jgi:hypothetical protein
LGGAGVAASAAGDAVNAPASVKTAANILCIDIPGMVIAPGSSQFSC